MSGAHRVQELDVLRGEVTLVFSLDGLNWLCRRRCGGEGREKRGEELQFWLPSGQMMAADEKLQPTTCFRIHKHRGSALRDLWRDTDCRSSSVTRPSSFSLSAQFCRPLGNSSVPEFPEEAPWTRLILNPRDVFTLITRNVNLASQQHTFTMDRPNRSIIFCDEDIQPRPFGEIRSTRDRRTLKENAGNRISNKNNVSRNLKNAQSLADLNNNSEDDHGEAAPGENFNMLTLKSLLKPCQNYNHPGESPGRDGDVKMRRSVSFNDDVIVYLFDQESPTAQLRSEPLTSLPSSSACDLPDVTYEDSGLEWEDDFSALERSSRLQRDGHHAPSLPTRSWTDVSRPQRYLPSQTGLFLTHVAASDLEL
ncbi:uncharacterized protein LOC118287928 [Scophthalmus maximus]|uniref:uncharacterized protein LOC118287928 n=1 Tax=Scophthalmus maximus TaxID=52904 RepID=UPI001FA8F2F0|nr:uncharacterized protein LOC118287928 [Scophthalmus maximus]